MSIKRFISLALTAFMLVSLLIPAFAADPKVELEGETVLHALKEGDVVELPVKLKSNPGFTLGSVVIDYNKDAFELIGITVVDLPTGEPGEYGDPESDFDTDLDNYSYVSPSQRKFKVRNPGTYTLAFGSDLATKAYTSNGTLFTLKFKILAAADIGDYKVTISPTKAFKIAENKQVSDPYFYKCVDTSDTSIEKVALAVDTNDIITTGTIKLRGNIAGEKTVNIADVVALARYVKNKTKYPLSINVDYADITGDGNVNIADVVALARYVKNQTKYPIKNK